MATGLIAYDRLAGRDPAAIAAVDALIAQHPDRARFETALQGLAGDARTRMLFALIARWPDDVRTTRYNHTHWHHQLRVVVGWTAFRGLRPGSADRAFRQALARLRDKAGDPGRRAIALCWLIHIAGDMHQPLHAGQRQDAHFPLSDLAGTIGWVRRSADAPPETLHHFWDSAADRPTDDLVGASALAAAAEAQGGPDSAAGDDPIADYRAWVQESEAIARDVAYPRMLQAERGARDKAKILPPAYVAQARAIAERRIGQAGDRIAALLAALFPQD